MAKEKEEKENSTGQEEPIYSQLEDRVMKTAAVFFGQDLLPYAGFHKKIVGIAPTEAIHLEVRKMEEDFNFILEDGTWLHLEFESDSITEQDLRRFREYDAYTSLVHGVSVMTGVVCTSKAKVLKSQLSNGINTYRIKVIRVKDKSADEIFHKLEHRLKKKQKLTRRDIVPILLTPLMSGKMPAGERFARAIKLMQSEENVLDKEELKKMEAVLYALAIKLLNQDELKKVKEMIRMTLLGQMLREDGIIEGLEKGEWLKLITQVMKKMQKGQSPEEIADDLVENLSVIQPICDFIMKNPGCNATAVYEKLIRK